MKSFSSITEYIKSFPPEVQTKLNEIYKIVRSIIPKEAVETISYGIPTFKLNGNLIHFGGFKDHVSLFPGGEATEIFKAKLTKFKTSKGTIQFSLDEDLPVSLIKEVTEFCVKKNLSKAKNKTEVE